MARISNIQAKPVCRAAQGGFTIIELLTSMTILIFIVMMMTRVFSEATSVWRLGAERISTATEGRAVMDFMVNELTQAIADDVVSFKLSSGAQAGDFGVSAYGADSDELYFGAVVQPGRDTGKRNLNQFAYFIAPMLDDDDMTPMPYRYRLARTRRTESMYASPVNRANSIYKQDTWWPFMKPTDNYTEENNNTGMGCETVAENIAAFEVWAYSEATGYYEPDYSSRHNGDPALADNKDMLPLWVDIYLEMLGEDDAKMMAELWPINQQSALEYLSKNVKRFTARVYFPNRERALTFQK